MGIGDGLVDGRLEILSRGYMIGSVRCADGVSRFKEWYEGAGRRAS